jgi:hypothetical protein
MQTRSVCFAQPDVEPFFRAAAPIVIAVRAQLDAATAGQIKVRQSDGSAKEFRSGNMLT